MVFKNLCILVLWTKVATVLEELTYCIRAVGKVSKLDVQNGYHIFQRDNECPVFQLKEIISKVRHSIDMHSLNNAPLF